MQGKRNKTIISRITENRNFGLLLGLAVLLIIAAIVTPSMYSLNSILSMLQNSCRNACRCIVRSNQWNFGWISENGANDRNTGNDVYFQGSFVPFE